MACLREDCAHLHLRLYLELYCNGTATVCVLLSKRCDRPSICCSAPAVFRKCVSEGRRRLSRACAGMCSSSARRRAQETAFCSAECTRALAVAARGGRIQGTAFCSAECVLALASAARGANFQGTAFCSAGAVTGFCPSSTSLPWVLGLCTVLSGVTKGLPPCAHGHSRLSTALCQVLAPVDASLPYSRISWEPTAMQHSNDSPSSLEGQDICPHHAG